MVWKVGPANFFQKIILLVYTLYLELVIFDGNLDTFS